MTGKTNITDNNNDDLIHIPCGLKESLPVLLEQFPIPNCRVKSKDLQKEYLFFFLSYIFVKQKRLNGEEENKPVPLASASIRKYESGANQFIKWLCERGILETDNKYMVGECPKYYKFVENNHFEEYRLAHERLIKRITKARQERIDETYGDSTSSKLLERMNRVEIDREKAEAWIMAIKRGRAARSCLDNLSLAINKDLAQGYFIAHSVRCGRVYTPHTNLPKQIRNQFLTIDGEPSAELDLKCAQPQILYLLFKDHEFKNDPFGNRKKDFQIEMEGYVKCFKDGNMDLYSLLSLQKKWTRETAKKNVLTWLFSNLWQMEVFKSCVEISEGFKSLFPILFGLIIEYKSMPKSNLAIELQKIESNTIIKKIAIDRLYKEGFSFITIHDSILIPKSKLDYVKNSIWEPVLRKLGFPQYLENYDPKFEIQERRNIFLAA